MKLLAYVHTLATLCCAGCTVSLAEALARLPPLKPSEPVTVEDSLTARTVELALSARLVHGPYLVLADSDGPPASASLPHADSIRFVFMTLAQVQPFADEYGDFSYITVGPALVTGNDGRVGFGVMPVVSRTRGPVVLFG